MCDVHPHYLTDTAGKKLVMFSLDEFETIMEEVDDLKDVRLFDQAKREDDGQRMLLSD